MNNHKNFHSRTDFFGKDRAQSYDESNRHLLPIQANLHYLIEILLEDLNPLSKILCVGAGTGSEILALAAAFPKLTFVAVDPSEAMLEVCRDRLASHGWTERCQLLHGVIQDVPAAEDFDAALCLLVLHHTSNGERRSILEGVAKRLKPKGRLITSELSHELAGEDTDEVMENWKSLIRRSGAPEDRVQLLPALMKQKLSIMSPSEIEDLIRKSGFERPTPFFQSFLIRAWHTRKRS